MNEQVKAKIEELCAGKWRNTLNVAGPIVSDPTVDESYSCIINGYMEAVAEDLAREVKSLGIEGIGNVSAKYIEGMNTTEFFQSLNQNDEIPMFLLKINKFTEGTDYALYNETFNKPGMDNLEMTVKRIDSYLSIFSFTNVNTDTPYKLMCNTLMGGVEKITNLKNFPQNAIQWTGDMMNIEMFFAKFDLFNEYHIQSNGQVLTLTGGLGDAQIELGDWLILTYPEGGDRPLITSKKGEYEEEPEVVVPDNESLVFLEDNADELMKRINEDTILAKNYSLMKSNFDNTLTLTSRNSTCNYISTSDQLHITYKVDGNTVLGSIKWLPYIPENIETEYNGQNAGVFMRYNNISILKRVYSGFMQTNEGKLLLVYSNGNSEEIKAGTKVTIKFEKGYIGVFEAVVATITLKHEENTENNPNPRFPSIQFTGENFEEVRNFCIDEKLISNEYVLTKVSDSQLTFKYPEHTGKLTVTMNPGDWIKVDDAGPNPVAWVEFGSLEVPNNPDPEVPEVPETFSYLYKNESQITELYNKIQEMVLYKERFVAIIPGINQSCIFMVDQDQNGQLITIPVYSKLHFGYKLADNKLVTNFYVSAVEPNDKDCNCGCNCACEDNCCDEKPAEKPNAQEQIKWQEVLIMEKSENETIDQFNNRINQKIKAASKRVFKEYGLYFNEIRDLNGASLTLPNEVVAFSLEFAREESIY